jgi:5-methylcytosine-specific restriction protein B
VQFHPATSYEDFFEGLRPTVTDAGQVNYERTDGPLVLLADKAAGDPAERPHVLVIDEINRANLPKVLGELLFLLEYRDESASTLYRPKTPFKLPTNLWFIATMNTADRSIALIDAAMRRRFHFVPFFPHDGAMKGLLARWLKDGKGRAGVADFLDAVIDELVALVGEHLLIGPSHFMKTDLSDNALRRIWTYNVFPLIEEQLWGDREQIHRWRWDVVRTRFADKLGGPAKAATSESVAATGGDVVTEEAAPHSGEEGDATTIQTGG